MEKYPKSVWFILSNLTHKAEINLLDLHCGSSQNKANSSQMGVAGWVRNFHLLVVLTICLG